jgi:hypothetical protein|tara:strand:+ start:27 stop:269 length:243 start_codon:yes stop_codon:yes gene_type:complete
MGRVFPEQAMNASGINRTDLVGVCAFLKRTGQASSGVDALRRLEEGEFNKHDIEEQMIRAYQKELPPKVVVLDEDDGYHD